MSDTNCPYCGEPEETDTPTGITIYRCGTLIYPNGSFVTTLICVLGRDLRREREAHNNTKRERDKAIELAEKAIQTAEMVSELYQHGYRPESLDRLRAELDQLKEIEK